MSISKEYAISIAGVSKHFKLYDNPITGPVKEYLTLGRKKPYKRFTAVKNVSLNIRKGEVVGVIGPNGSGKTTLLKMVAGLLPVDEGVIDVNGKVTALLALGVGVHPEFTGKENIYYGGLLLGMSREEILSKMDQIIEFAELGPFIDQPFRTYSSGMKARLLFSISMSINPDILIVDEALSTGDDYFLQKSTRKIHELCDSGATILFVSHNLTQIQTLCDRAVILENGKIVTDGAPIEIVREYQERAYARGVSEVATIEPGTLKPIAGTAEVLIKSVVILDADQKETTSLRTGNPYTIQIEYVSSWDDRDAELFIGFVEPNSGKFVGEITSFSHINDHDRTLDCRSVSLGPEGKIQIEMANCVMLNNHYTLWIVIQSADAQKTKYCEYKNIAPFFIARPDNVIGRGPFFWQPCSFK